MEKNAQSYKKREKTFKNFLIKSQKKSKQQKAKKQQKICEQLFKQKFDNLLLQIKDTKKLKQNIKLGPPIKYRWAAWKYHLFKQLTQQDVDLYNIIKNAQSKDETQIIKDLNRTFPDQIYFQPKSPELKQEEDFQNESLEKLRRILSSICIIYPNLGYCQGMNFLIGFMLLVNGGNEQEAFLMFKVLAEDPNFMLMGLYENDFPMLKFLEYCVGKSMKKYLKEVWNHILFLEIEYSYWLTKWILTLFLYSIPIQCCARLWDFLISNSIFGICELVVSMLYVLQDKILCLNDQIQFMQFFQSNNFEKLNMSQIVGLCEKFPVKNSCIAKYAKKFILKVEKDNQYALLYSFLCNQKNSKKSIVQ
ncbi:TBC domain protein [Ichthyophthirius multifiliis]|uniref:TBC domain protein n=1 Tax=Ichthyophthirius multifiliis TaxID=5932 RepID=G0QYN8_ICHMU|nr:TBC domain protein [Ichthyophthirius multifiliis]EGR29665.1 TBC domain protein [Ichthyophthirius multifiliis]|eukprot:XP_004030901.1 TBC domain protein [Ichthyophthirius multifiliis]